jgi:glutathione synthase/RimK-type ligase-like ATP-grasp enzyme
MLIGIIRNEDPASTMKWEIACRKKEIPFEVIDFTSADWMEQIQARDFDFFLLRPPGMTEHYKVLFDERLYILTQILGKKTFPSYDEVIVYENKKFLSYFLKAKGIPLPRTDVFYNKSQALEFCRETQLPVIAKTSIGASGTGVTVFRSRKALRKYILKAFSSKGIKRRFGPNRATGTPRKWIKKALNSPAYFKKRLKEYFTIYKSGQRNYVILQEYIPHEYEWRMARIGESYFGHKKIKQGDMASGTKGIDYVDPPVDILNFTRELCEKNNFNSMAIDIFEHPEKGYVVNELQTIFGHVQDYILEVDGKPGRYLFKDGNWLFEAGDFNTNESYDLRLETAISLYEGQK